MMFSFLPDPRPQTPYPVLRPLSSVSSSLLISCFRYSSLPLSSSRGPHPRTWTRSVGTKNLGAARRNRSSALQGRVHDPGRRTKDGSLLLQSLFAREAELASRSDTGLRKQTGKGEAFTGGGTLFPPKKESLFSAGKLKTD